MIDDWLYIILRYINRRLNKLFPPETRCLLVEMSFQYNRGFMNSLKYAQVGTFFHLLWVLYNMVKHRWHVWLQWCMLLVTAQEVSKWWMKLLVCNYPPPAQRSPAYHFRTIVPHFSHRNNDNWSDITHTDQRQTPVVRKICSEPVNGYVTSACSAHG